MAAFFFLLFAAAFLALFVPTLAYLSSRPDWRARDDATKIAVYGMLAIVYFALLCGLLSLLAARHVL